MILIVMFIKCGIKSESIFEFSPEKKWCSKFNRYKKYFWVLIELIHLGYYNKKEIEMPNFSKQIILLWAMTNLPGGSFIVIHNKNSTSLRLKLWQIGSINVQAMLIVQNQKIIYRLAIDMEN